MTEALIQVRDVSKQYRQGSSFFERAARTVHALTDVSLDVFSNEILGLVGESGCGKTTLGKILLLLQIPSSGTVLFENKDVFSFGAKDVQSYRKNVQMIFQDPYESLNPRFSVYSAVAEPLVVQGERTNSVRDRVLEAIEEVELKPAQDYLLKFPHELSGGQRQRISLARALVARPRFIVADEPVSMLDVSIRAGILNLFLKLRERFGIGFLFITHDFAVARYVCDRIAVMYAGQIVEAGPAKSICSNPQHPYTQALIEAVPEIGKSHRQELPIHGQISVVTSRENKCCFVRRCPKAFQRCETEIPGAFTVGQDHVSCCFLHNA